MLRTLLLLLDVLTNYQAIAAFARDMLLFGMGNAAAVGARFGCGGRFSGH